MNSEKKGVGLKRSRWDNIDEGERDASAKSAKKKKIYSPSESWDSGKGSKTTNLDYEGEHHEDGAKKVRDPLEVTRCQLARPPIRCRNVDEIYEKLNKIAEGSYGIVYRVRDRKTGEVVALKKLKHRSSKQGFPIYSLREIKILQLARHENIVRVNEIVTTECYKHIFLVMEFYEHDLKSLMENMHVNFLQSEMKTLMLQLLSAVAYLHKNYIIHRDIKTTNLLLNNRGQLKLADFGLAREYGSPPVEMTQLVVTLWYRAPEILLGKKLYDTSIDVWSVGCVMGELINKDALFMGKTELDQIKKIFQLLGTPDESSWPGISSFSFFNTFKFTKYDPVTLRKKFPYATEKGIDLLNSLLKLNPSKRISAQDAFHHPYFSENPLPKSLSLFPTFPSKYSQPVSSNTGHNRPADSQNTA